MNTTMEENKWRIANVLESFKIGWSDMEITEGPSVTLYEFRPAIGVKLTKIRNLKDEFALALMASSVRVIAPIPGRGTVGIEVPHKKKTILPLSDIFESPEFRMTSMTLPLAIGRTITNKVFIRDLADMPHLLVAGATGQGKSVGLNVMLMSLLRKKTPDELKLVLIDPKKVELSAYEKIARPYITRMEGLPAIITEADHAQIMLDGLCRLMEKRYTLLNQIGARNIMEYNASSEKKMEYYVIVIDEYGDLVMQSGKEMERLICRLAQKARAVGMHMVISTQRPSATIVTGNIKANFPTRIAFRTTTGTDSRVILDQIGAEKLTGCGDMLFFSGAEVTRAQCAFIGTDEVNDTLQKIGELYATHRPKVLRVINQQQQYDNSESLRQLAEKTGLKNSRCLWF